MTFGQRVVVGLLVLLLLGGALAAVLVGRGGDGPRPGPPTPAGEPNATSGPGIVGVFVQPDDGRAPILDELAAARRTIDLEVYLLSDEEIIAALERAVTRGVRVRVILEEDPFGGAGGQPAVFERLAAAGVQVRWSNPVFRFTHVKTFVIDDRVAIIMNLNLTRSAFTRNREFGAITTRPGEVAEARAIFAADWSRADEPAPGPLIVSPTDSRAEILGLIDGANDSLDIYAEVVRDREAVSALKAAERRGVRVRLIMSDPDDDGDEERAELAAAGVEVRIENSPYIHAKLIVADGGRAFLGSQNFTATSLDQNREIGLMIADGANLARLASVFAADWAVAAPLEGD